MKFCEIMERRDKNFDGFSFKSFINLIPLYRLVFLFEHLNINDDLVDNNDNNSDDEGYFSSDSEDSGYEGDNEMD